LVAALLEETRSSNAEIRSTVLNALSPSTKNGSAVEPEVYCDFFFATFNATEFSHNVTDGTLLKLFSEYSNSTFFKERLMYYTGRILALSHGIKETVDRAGEVSELQPLSKIFLEELIKNFFVGNRNGAIYAKPLLYRTVFNRVPYKGKTDHTISAEGRSVFVFVWEDKIHLNSDADRCKAITQTALEIHGELTRLRESLGITPVEYCAIVTNGMDFFLVSCRYEMGERRWRHSNMVSTVIEGSEEIRHEVIDQVVQLIAYAFVCANDILALIGKVPACSPRPPTIEETREGDEDVEDLSRALRDKTNISDRGRGRGRGRGQRGGTKGGAVSGKGTCLSDFNEYEILTIARVDYHDKENIPIDSRTKAALGNSYIYR
jgi:hypothetical protein